MIRYFLILMAMTTSYFSAPNNQAEAQVDARFSTPPPFSNTAGTVFDIIRETDPSTFTCLEYIGREERQIWDKRVDGEPVVNTFAFTSQFSDGTTIQISLNPEFETVESARTEAMRYVIPLGQLPTSLREGIKYFSIHKGDQSFHAGDEQVIMYADKVDQRLSYNHLEESIFHESVHASWDAEHRLSAGWKNAQANDGKFLTRYGQQSPEREDLAETALFAYALIHHPGRIPPVDTEDTRRAVPDRIAYIESLLPADAQLHYPVRPAQGCEPQL